MTSYFLRSEAMRKPIDGSQVLLTKEKKTQKDGLYMVESSNR